MIDAFAKLNVIAIVAALVLSFVFGGLWFGVAVAKVYAIALGREKLQPQKPSALFIVGPLVCNIFAVVTSAVLLRMLHIDSVPSALGFGLLIGIGYVMSTAMNIAINPNFPRPFLYAAINAPYFIVSNLATCVILVLMP